MAEKVKNTFQLYNDYKEKLSSLSKEDLGELFWAILCFENGEEYEINTPMARLAFDFMRPQLQRDIDAWNKTVKDKEEAAKKRWDKSKSSETDAEPMQNDADTMHTDAEPMQNDAESTDKDKEKDKEKDTDKDTEKETDKDKDTETKTKPARNAGRRAERVYFPLDEKLDAEFKSFLDMRKRIRAPATDRAIELLIKKLGEMSTDPDEQLAIIQQSTENGWKGFYPLKNEQKPGDLLTRMAKKYGGGNDDETGMWEIGDYGIGVSS